NLGYLYENGLGVEKDTAKALNLYRLASGAESELVFAEDAQKELDELRRSLESQVKSAREEAQYLEKQIESLQSQVNNSAAAPQSTDTQLTEDVIVIEVLQNVSARSPAELEELIGKMEDLPQFQYGTATTVDLIQPVKISDKGALTFNNIDFR